MYCPKQTTTARGTEVRKCAESFRRRQRVVCIAVSFNGRKEEYYGWCLKVVVLGNKIQRNNDIPSHSFVALRGQKPPSDEIERPSSPFPPSATVSKTCVAVTAASALTAHWRERGESGTRVNVP